MKKIIKHKWWFNWIAFTSMVGTFIFFALYFNNKPWLSNALQTIGTVTGIYLTLIVFLQSKEESDKQFQDQINHLQLLNTNQIDALYKATENQIQALQEINSKQILALQELTERQIEALNKTTFNQISSFEHEIREVTNKLTDNSILLAEILGRELEKSIDLYSNVFQQEQAKYNDLNGWKLLRTEEEKKIQLETSLTRIQRIKAGIDYLQKKYNQIRQYLENGKKLLNN